jgi:hypothetical protein
MNSNRVSSWLTLGANIGVIVGIAFLVVELRQNSDIATAQARLEYSAGWRSVDASRQDAAFAATLATSIETPDRLSLVEVIQLDAYYWGVVDQMLSAKTASDTGLREAPFENAAHEVAKLYFSNAFARTWWQQVRSNWSSPGEQEFLRIMDKEISAMDGDQIVSPYQRIHQSLKSRTTDSSN